MTDGHRLRWRDGSLLALDHGPADRVLGALGGDVCPCLLVQEVSGRRASPPIRAVDARSLLPAELLDRLGGLSPHLAVGQADVVRAARGSDDPARRMAGAYAAAHLVPRPVLDRILLGRLVGMERRPPPPGSTARWGLEAAIGVRATRAAREAFGPVARGRVRVELRLCEEDEEPGLEVDGPTTVRLVLGPAWLRTVWWPGLAVRPGGRFHLEAHRAVRLERRRGGPVAVEIELGDRSG